MASGKRVSAATPDVGDRVLDWFRERLRADVALTAFAVDASSAARAVRVARLGPGAEPPALRRELLPMLLLPLEPVHQPAASAPVVVALEGKDSGMPARLSELFDPRAVKFSLLHVTWLPGIVAAPIDEHGLDDPAPTDLLLYDGALNALVDMPAELRAAGYDVTTHLRMSRQPSEGIAAFVIQREAACVVLGLGRHGAGIGRNVIRQPRIPVLYVDARPV
jgi:hypothetical protein